MNGTISLPAIINNDEKLYKGNLIWYFRIIFYQAQNVLNPFHNFRHMFHVLCQCYDACKFYSAELTPEKIRVILIAAMFHDFDHCGMMGNDDLNIERSIRALNKHQDVVDTPILDDIISLIRVTEFPYKIPHESLDLSGLILRDADMTQALDKAWIQEVVFGLASEWRKTPAETLCLQKRFLQNLRFYTKWAQERFPQAEINAKVKEVLELLVLIQK